MPSMKYPRLVFKEEFDERLAFEVAQKGWCGIAVVQLPNGDSREVFFYDPGRLAQDLEVGIKSGEPFIAEPGLIVIPEVTLAYMNEAVNKLFDGGYFDRLTRPE